MLALLFCFVSLLSSVTAAAIRTEADGFILMEINGQQHFSYGVVPVVPGQNVRLEFRDVDFGAQDCSNMRIDIYRTGFVKMPQDLIQTVCDPAVLADFTAESTRGFYITMVSSPNVRNGQFRGHFTSQDGVKITHEILYR